MKLLFLSKYSSLAPSSRYRFYQYIPFFEKEGIHCDIVPFTSKGINTQLKNKFSLIYFSLFKSILYRFILLFKVFNYDLIIIQAEIIPYFPPLIEYLLCVFKRKYILDYDDAIFHNYDLSKNKIIYFLFRKKIPYIIKHASAVVTGSPYLTSWSLKHNKNVIEIPTSVNIDKYIINRKIDHNKFVIGWIGSSTTSCFIIHIFDAIRTFAIKYPDVVEFRLIGFNKDFYDKNIFPDNVKIIDWKSDTEIIELNNCDAGIMPLLDTPHAKGKCGFKLIQYMALQLSTISTPLDANIQINRGNNNLFALTEGDWINAFEEIYHNRNKYQEVGALNRVIVQKYYSLQVNYSKYIRLYNRILTNDLNKL